MRYYQLSSVAEVFVTNVILFHHESLLRGREFVTSRIADSLARIRQGLMRKNGAR
ncbi:GDP-mannose 4,6-dehydratase [Pseudomonas sp. A-RE-7]|uniref:GDP-mannose 4,6-dehydratase n=1 Tax=Pseudomonas TaxID=286 RepID=UPI00398A416A